MSNFSSNLSCFLGDLSIKNIFKSYLQGAGELAESTDQGEGLSQLSKVSPRT